MANPYTHKPVTLQVLAERLDKIEDLLEKMVMVLSTMQIKNEEVVARKKEHNPPFIKPKEAAKILGLNITKSSTHTRRLAWYRNNGFLTLFQGSRPIHYSRSQVMALAKKIERGEAPIPPVL